MRPITPAIQLSAFTEEELDEFEAFIQAAIDMARPYCRELDNLSVTEREAGNKNMKRLWRPAPMVWIREIIPEEKDKEVDNPDEHSDIPEVTGN